MVFGLISRAEQEAEGLRGPQLLCPVDVMDCSCESFIQPLGCVFGVREFTLVRLSLSSGFKTQSPPVLRGWVLSAIAKTSPEALQLFPFGHVLLHT